MPRHERSSTRESREVEQVDRRDRFNKEKPRDSRRRHRSPSYDSSDSDSSYDSDSTRVSSPARRPSRRHTNAYSDSEDRNYRRGRDRERRARNRYDSDDSPSPEKRSVVEDLLSAVGLIQSKDKGGSSRRDRGDRDDDEKRKNTRQAIQAALTAAAMEAFRTRKEGKLTPQRLMQIAGAAIAAGGLDALIDSRGGGGSGMKSIVESVIAGLATSKTMGKNIKHKREGSMESKVKTGMVGMAAKQLLSRSLSRGPNRRRTNRF